MGMTVRLGLLLPLAWLALGGPGSGRAVGQTFDDPLLTTEVFASGLSAPTGIAFLDPGDVLVTEKGGALKRVREGLAPELVATFDVETVSERGLLGIAISSSDPPAVFLYRTEDAGVAGIRNRVYRYEWIANDLSGEQLVLDLPGTPGPNHDGGPLLLGPPGAATGPGAGDGALLYAVIGDLNRNGQLENFPTGALPDDTAVVLRVLQDGTPAPGNPFDPYCELDPGTPCSSDPDCAPASGSCITAVARYYAYGVRNSFGLALDPLGGALWDTENGPFTYDEINRLDPGTNSGWESLMGPESRDPQDPNDLFEIPGSFYSDPEFSWLDTIAPTSIVFPVGSSLGGTYDGVALVGDNNTGKLFRFPLNAGRTGFALSDTPELLDLVADDSDEADLLVIGSGFPVVTGMVVGPDSHLYILSLVHGSIFRVRGPDAIPFAPTVVLVGLGLAALVVLVWRQSSRSASLNA